MAYRDSLGDLNYKISSARRAASRQVHIERLLAQFTRERAELELNIDRLERVATQERRDVDRLERNSLTAKFHELLGNRQAKLQKERQDLALVMVELERLNDELASLECHRDRLSQERDGLGDPHQQLDRLLSQKEQWLREQGSPASQELAIMGREIGRLKTAAKELSEAREAGEFAKRWLRSALDNEAADKPELAEKNAANARIELRNFRRELLDVQAHLLATVEIDRFSSVGSSTLCQGAVATLGQVESALLLIAGQLAAIWKKISQLTNKRTALVEQC